MEATGVNCDCDLRFNSGGWTYQDFRGKRWSNIANVQNRSYFRNANRDLLTRDRQGMVIFVPPASQSIPHDRPNPTISPSNT